MAAHHTQAYRGLIDDLVRERLTGEVSRGFVSSAMQWGIDHENAARRWYAKSHNRSVSEIGFVVHPQLDFVGVSPDGLVGHDGLVEIKCPQLPNFQRVLRSGAMPTQYRWQVQGQLWVCQREWLDFVCFYPPGQGAVIRIERNYADFARLAERCGEIDLELAKQLSSRTVRTRSVPAAKPKRESHRWVARPDDQLIHRQDPREQKSEGGWWIWIALAIGALILFNR